MAKGVRSLQTKTVVSAAALEMFVEEFAPAREMIHALVDLVELAVTHELFGTPGYPGADAYDWADMATDVIGFERNG